KFKREKPAGDKPDPKKELAKLNGKWQVVNQEVDGQTHGEEVARTNVWVIKDGKITSRYFDTNEGAEKVNEWPFKIDPTQNPAHIDVEFDVAGQKRTIMGIYKLDGDELTICLFGAVDERPTEFRNSRKGGNLVIKFKRQKQ
ncbi:MAG TPA: TIGR03067 domain-containing protein, partial [Gemmataceae bacterium]|nr:TIGR03067 domain-containing protein [Gemmataceae bacterium]